MCRRPQLGPEGPAPERFGGRSARNAARARGGADGQASSAPAWHGEGAEADGREAAARRQPNTDGAHDLDAPTDAEREAGNSRRQRLTLESRARASRL